MSHHDLIAQMMEEEGGIVFPPWANLIGTPNTSFTTRDTNPTGLCYTGDQVGVTYRTSSKDVDLYDIANPPTLSSSLDFTVNQVRGCTIDDSGNLIRATPALIIVYDGLSTDVLTSFAVPGSFCSGVCWTPDGLITTDVVTLKYYLHDGVSDTILYTRNMPDNIKVVFTNVAWDGTDMYTCGGAFINKHVGKTESVASTIAAPASACEGMVFDSVNMWTSDDITDKVYTHDGFSVFVP